MNIEEAKKRMEEVRDKNVHTFVGELTIVLSELEKKDKQITELKEFLKKEQLELHDYDDNHDLSCEGKGRMYLVDELLEDYFRE